LIGGIVLLVVVVLALPVQRWRTGEVPQPELQYAPTTINAVKATRVWIDADAACGTGKHRDPDDCLALLSLASATRIVVRHLDGVRQRAGFLPASAHRRATTR